MTAGRWEPERPEAKSLWLLPSGSDQVGDDHVRPTPARHMAEAGQLIKRAQPGIRTVSPSSASSSTIWHDNRLVRVAP